MTSWLGDSGVGVGGGVGIGALHNTVSCKASWHILKLLYVYNNQDKFHRIFTFVCYMGDEVSYSMAYGIAKKMSHHIFVQKFYPSASFSILTNTHVAVDIYRVRVEHRWHLINHISVQKNYPSASFSILTNTHVAVDIYRVRVEHRWHLINELKAHYFIFTKTTRRKLILI